MGEFFEPPPPPPEPLEPPRRYRTPPWVGPPHGTLPGVVSFEAVLARTDTAAVCLRRIAAFPQGVEFDVTAFTEADDRRLDPFAFSARLQPEAGIPDDLLRFGLRLADGGKATNLDGLRPDGAAPDGPVLQDRGGGGGSGQWGQTYWLWPLPPPGPLTVVCEWPALGIPQTEFELEADGIRAAAARAQVLFDDGPSLQIVR